MLDSNFWEKYFGVYDILNVVLPYQDLMDDLDTSLNIQRGQKVLDAGSGTGNFSIRISRKYNIEVTSIDFAREGISLHKSKDASANVFFHDLSKKLPFNNEKFDRIVCNNVLYSIKPSVRGGVVRELNRVLKAGGILVVSNMKEGWKPFAIYKQHIFREYRSNGLWRTLVKIIKLIIPTIRMFHYNNLIRRESAGDYKFVTVTDQEDLVRDSGFSVEFSKKTYADQAILTKAIKI